MAWTDSRGTRDRATRSRVTVNPLILLGASPLAKLLVVRGPKRRARLAIRVLAEREDERRHLQRALAPSVDAGDRDAIVRHNELSVQLQNIHGCMTLLDAKLHP